MITVVLVVLQQRASITLHANQFSLIKIFVKLMPLGTTQPVFRKEILNKNVKTVIIMPLLKSAAA